jgi:hypothetical protein
MMDFKNPDFTKSEKWASLAFAIQKKNLLDGLCGFEKLFYPSLKNISILHIF